MKPKKEEHNPQRELFKVELNRIVDKSHPLAKLSDQMDWRVFDEAFEKYFSDEGRPAIATRLMVSLQYLQYTYDLSDEEVLLRWVENPYWQYVSGRQYFEHEVPIDSSSMTRWRHRIGMEGAEKLLGATIRTALEQGYLKPMQCRTVSVDTTVQTKDIRFPTDARLYDRMRDVLVGRAQREGVELRQSYTRVGKKLLRRQQSYAHAKQYRRAERETKRLKTILGRVVRDIGRKIGNPSDRMERSMDLARRLLQQERGSKNKIYSVHEPQVECIAKGKAHQRYEFGSKAGFVLTGKGNWILGAQSFTGNPYDGHTLGGCLLQAQQLSGIGIERAICDLGYRGHSVPGLDVLIVPRKKKRASAWLQRLWRRRNAIEPVIGHQKREHRLERNRLAGELGDKLNAVFAACGFNIKKLLRAFWPLLRKLVRTLCGLRLQTAFA